MKVYAGQKELRELVCNKCGRKLKVENGMLREGIFEAKQNFGYFSNKDGRTHEFDLCEACYDEFIATFVIPVTQKEEFDWQVD